MKIKLLFIILFIPTLAIAGNYEFLDVSGVGGGGGGATDYTLDSNCMGAWYMNANGGLETDRSGELGTLSEVNSVTRSTDVPSGYSGYSRFVYSTGNGYLYHNDGNSTDISGADQEITVAAWVRFSNLPVERYIASKGGKTSNESWRLWGESADTRFHVAISNDGTTTTEAIGATNISVSTWYHVAFVYDDTDIRIYVDGSLDSNGADNPKAYTDGLYDSSAAFYVGRCVSYYTSADIDELIVFNRALSATEINNLYTNGISGNTGGND